MKTLIMINLSALGLLLSFVAFAGTVNQNLVPNNLQQAISKQDNKGRKINTINDRLIEKRVSSRLVERPVITPIHFR